MAIESSYWFIKSEKHGRLSVGLQSSAADNQAILPDGSGSLVQANYVLYDINAFSVVNSAGGNTGFGYSHFANCYPLADSLGASGGVAGDCDGYPKNVVRYDTPTFAGFSASASWGEDDDWAISGRYSGEHHGIKIALAAAYNHTSDETNVNNGASSILSQNNALFALVGALPDRPNGFEGSAWQIGGYIEHVATGLFLYGAYIEENNDSNTGIAAWDTKPEGDTWYIKAGIRQRWLPLGHTVLYGEYGEDNDKMSVPMFATGVTSSELERYGLGVVQEIDAAAMSVWLSWRHYEASAFCGASVADGGLGDALGNCAGLNMNAGANSFEEFDLIKAGALINF